MWISSTSCVHKAVAETWILQNSFVGCEPRRDSGWVVKRGNGEPEHWLRPAAKLSSAEP